MQKKIIISIVILLLAVFMFARSNDNDKTAKNLQTNNVLDEMVLNEKTGEYESLKDGNSSQSEQINDTNDATTNNASSRSSSDEKGEIKNEKDEENYLKYVYPYFEESSEQHGMQTLATGKWEKEKGFQLLARILLYEEGEELVYAVGYLDDKGEWNEMKRFESAKENIYNLDGQFKYPGYLDKSVYSSKGISVGGNPAKFLESKISFVSGGKSIVSTIDHVKAMLISDIPIVPIKEWAVCGDVITYAEQIYNTVQIGSQCWFKENLNIGTRLCSNDKGSNQCAANQGVTCESIDKYCYYNSESNCISNGAFYQWDQAMCGSVNEGAQGICPDGWHIPTDAEFKILEVELGMTQKRADDFRRNGSDTEQVTKLLSGGSSGFDAVFASGRKVNNINQTGTNGLFGDRAAYFWSSSEDGNNAWSRSLSQYLKLSRVPMDKLSGYSIRCLKD